MTALAGSAPVTGVVDDMTAADAGAFLRVAEGASASILSFRIDTSATTSATHLVSAGAPVAVTGGQVEHILASPDGRLVFASTAFVKKVVTFDVDPTTGALAFREATSAGEYPTELAVNAGSDLLHVLDAVSREIRVYRIGSTSLLLSDRSRTLPSPGKMTLLRGSSTFAVTDFVFVSNETTGMIDTFEFDRGDNILTAGTPVAAFAPQTPVFNQVHDVVYVPERDAGVFSVFTLDRENATLVPMTPPSVFGGEFPTDIVIGAAGRFAYGIDGDGTLLTLPIDPDTGALSEAVNAIEIPSNAGPLVVDPTGQSLFVLEPGTAEVGSYAINLTSGFPTFRARFSTPVAPVDMVILPQGRELYVLSGGVSSVSALAIDSFDGSVALHGTDHPAGSNPVSLDIMEQGFNLYTGSATDASITIGDVDFLTGEVNSFSAGVSPVAIQAGFSDLRVGDGDLFVFASFSTPSNELVVFRSQPTNSLLRVGSAPLAAGVHHIGVNATR